MNGLPHRLDRLGEWCLSNGLMPFGVAAARRHRFLRRSWPASVPRTFSEKLQYKIIADRRPIARLYSDKLAVRSYVRTLAPGLALPLLLGVFDRVADLIEWLPAGPWVMKASHGSGMVLLAPGRTGPPIAEIARLAHQWLHTDYALRYWEWHYHRLPRRILFEEFLGAGGRAPADYKLYVIHQQVRMITVDQDRFGAHTRNLFRPDWSEIPSSIGDAPRAGTPPARPARLAEMIAAAEALARDSDFLRVDLYLVGDVLYFGELTHAPGAGVPGFEDPAVDAELGLCWHPPRRYG